MPTLALVRGTDNEADQTSARWQRRALREAIESSRIFEPHEGGRFIMNSAEVRMKAMGIIAAMCLAGFAGAQSPSLTAPNNSAGEPNKSPAGAKAPATSPAPGTTDAAPTRNESARAAFDKLDREKLGYLTLNDIVQLRGNANFDDADRNKDGKLRFDEFEVLWNEYRAGNPK
jgi:hypothetical protein